MASESGPERWQDLLLRRVHASCLLAPLAVWYPPSANARDAAGQPEYGVRAISNATEGAAQQQQDAQRLQRIRRLAAALLHQPEASGEVQQHSAAPNERAAGDGDVVGLKAALESLHAYLISEAAMDDQLQVMRCHLF